jgi:hypothetical protein
VPAPCRAAWQYPSGQGHVLIGLKAEPAKLHTAWVEGRTNSVVLDAIGGTDSRPQSTASSQTLPSRAGATPSSSLLETNVGPIEIDVARMQPVGR